MRKKFNKTINKIVTGALVATMAFSFVPAFGTALTSVTVQAAEIGAVDPATCEHENTKDVSTKPATCLEKGHAKEICQDCGTVVDEWDTPKLKHRFDIDHSKITKEPTCTEDGERTYYCTLNFCNHTSTKTEVIPATGHDDGILKVTKEPTCVEAGLKETVCSKCGTVLEGKPTEEIPATGHHSWDAGKVTLAPTTTKEGVKIYTCTECGATKTEAVAKLPTATTEPTKGNTKPAPSKNDTKKPATSKPKAGTKVTVGGNTYVVTKVGSEVRFSKAKANIKALSIPATIKYKGITYKVTAISANAVKGNKKIKSATIGANVKSVAAKAFNNCPNLKTITIKSTKLTKKTASKKSFSKVNKKLVIKVPKKVKKTYAKVFKGYTVK